MASEAFVSTTRSGAMMTSAPAAPTPISTRPIDDTMLLADDAMWTASSENACGVDALISVHGPFVLNAPGSVRMMPAEVAAFTPIVTGAPGATEPAAQNRGANVICLLTTTD